MHLQPAIEIKSICFVFTVICLSETAPDCPPRLTSATATSSTSIRVSWTSLRGIKCINGVLRGYKVAYWLSKRGSRLNYININNPSATSVVVRGLVKYTQYIYQALAYTIKDGPVSNVLDARTHEDGMHNS